MRKFKCVCGSESFKVNPLEQMIQCWDCKKRFMWNCTYQKWIEFEVPLKNQIEEVITETREEIERRANKVFGWKDWREKFGIPIQKTKVLKARVAGAANPNVIPIWETPSTKKEYDERRLKARWSSELKIFKKHNRLVFDSFAHKGKLRGKHIAKACHRDFKLLGLKSKLKFQKNKGIVEAS